MFINNRMTKNQSILINNVIADYCKNKYSKQQIKNFIYRQLKIEKHRQIQIKLELAKYQQVNRTKPYMHFQLSEQPTAPLPLPSNQFLPFNTRNFHSLYMKKVSSKYSTCENYLTITQINRTIADKECIFKTTINDIKFDHQQEKMECYLSGQKLKDQLAELIEYYKYYSQKSVLFMDDLFPLMYQYQQKRKVVEYKKLKVLLNLSDSIEDDKSSSSIGNKKKGDVKKDEMVLLLDSKNQINHQQNLMNILDQLNQSSVISDHARKNLMQNQQSYLIYRMRKNMSKYIGSAKQLTIQELDKRYNFPKKNDIFHKVKENNFFQKHKRINIYKLNTKVNNNRNSTNTNPSNQKVSLNKKIYSIGSKISRQETHATTTPDDNCWLQNNNNKSNSRAKKSAKRNNSCENFPNYQYGFVKNMTNSPYQVQRSIQNSKLRRRENLSLDNLYQTGKYQRNVKQMKTNCSNSNNFPKNQQKKTNSPHTSTPFQSFRNRKNLQQKSIKTKKTTINTKETNSSNVSLKNSIFESSKQSYKQNKQPKSHKQTFLSNISQLKGKIKRQKQRMLMQTSTENNYNAFKNNSTNPFLKRQNIVTHVHPIQEIQGLPSFNLQKQNYKLAGESNNDEKNLLNAKFLKKNLDKQKKDKHCM